MNTTKRNKAKWIIPGLACTLLAGLIWEQENRPAPTAPLASQASEVGVQPGPQLEADVPGTEQAAAPGKEAGHLPADAHILPVEQIRYGKGMIEVVAGEVLARFSQDLARSDRDQLIARLGSSILLDDPATGYLQLKVPEGQTIPDFQARLEALDGVAAVRPNVVFHGTGNKCNIASSYYNFQWNLKRFRHPQACGGMAQDPSSVLVAVMDTGVAFETYGGYVKASDLNGVPVVAPYDFINNDAHPNDDHQHGTHIAVTIAGNGRVNGVTPGASLMPIKVLDAANQGNEMALARGLRWAVDHGAQIINMSLSFPTTYVPSGVLQDAISYVSAHNVLMVASTGNAGASTLPYPAAFRDVLSVGSVRMKRMSDGSIADELASYSNYGPGIDVVSPGGSLSYDADNDGWPDGVLAQTIRFQDPSQLSYFFYSGTSQAAAEVSGLAAWLVAAGATPLQAREAILATAQDLGDAGYDTRFGQGAVDLYGALNYFLGQSQPAATQYFANIVPAIYRANGDIWGVAQVKVVDKADRPVANAKVYGQWSGFAPGQVVGTTNANGYVMLPSSRVNDDGLGFLFALEINTIVSPTTGRPIRPKEFYYMSEGLAALLDGALSEDATQNSMLAFYVSRTDSSLGAYFDLNKLANSYMIKAIGPTLGTPGIGIAFTPEYIPGLADSSMARQDITINFGGPKAFGNGTRSSDTITVFSAGGGLLTSNIGSSSGVGLSASMMGRLGGVGLSASMMGRLGGVGLSASQMGKLNFDSTILKGASADGAAAELVRNEDPSSFLSQNSRIDGLDIGFSLSGTRFAVNSAEGTDFDAVISAASAEEADALMNSEMGMGSDFIDMEDAASLSVNSSPED